MFNRRRFLQSGALLAVPLSGEAQAPAGAPARPLPGALLSLRNRKAEAVPITLREREMRMERARTLMRAEGMDALVMAGGTSLVYFTGVRWGNSERMMCFVIPARGEAYFVCPAFEEARVRERLATVPGGQRTRVYAWQEHESPYGLVAQGLKESGVATGSLGVEERMPFVFANEIARAAPALKLVDGTPVVAGCREIKSPAELALMRLASQVTLAVYEAVYRSAHPGMTTEAFSEMVGLAYQQTGFVGEASCQTGIYSALPHGSMTPQVIKENEIVLIDDGCTVEGYQSDLSRTFVYGKPTDRMRRVFDVVHLAQATAILAAKPGVECQAIDAAARAVVTDARFGPEYKTFSHRVGHGIGMDGHEWPYLVRGNATKLRAGMTFSDEPGIYLEGEFGVRLEDDWVVTADGGKLMTAQSFSLEHPF